MAVDPTKAGTFVDAIEDLIDNTAVDDIDVVCRALKDYCDACGRARKALRYASRSDYAAEMDTEKSSLYTAARTRMGI